MSETKSSNFEDIDLVHVVDKLKLNEKCLLNLTK
jgi:hypothetical protein